LRKLYILIFITSLALSFSLNAQKLNPETIEYRYWIYFNDKGSYKPGDNLTPGSEGYELAKSELTEKALWRRSKVLAEDKLVGYDDIPVNKEYIQSIKNLGVTVNNVSKWMNAVSVNVKQDKLDRIKKLGYVDKIEGVHFLENVENKFLKNTLVNPVSVESTQQKTKYNYGYSYWQNEQIKVPVLHNMGVTGFNVTVGMCDDGFSWRYHEALKTRNVKDEYDWIFKDDSVHYQVSPNQIPTDPFDQDGHGTATMSTLGGFAPGQLIGPAFDVAFYLSKTEYGPTETPVEEDNYVAAVEWMEAQGIEVISCSLIYKPFDAPNNNYTYKDMDGKTTVIVRAAEHAAMLGIVVVNSMGNEAQTDPPSIVSPPDGEHVVSVGAVDSTGLIAYFSSNGPTSDGRIKPDVVAMGVEVYTAASYSFTQDTAGYSLSSGTSFSCPLTAGVCALILSVHPQLTPQQVKEALHNTADKKNKPGNVYGWGLVNSYEAALYYGMIMSNKPEIESVGDNMRISIYTASKKLINPESVKMFYSLDGAEFKELLMGLVEKTDENNSGKYSVSVPFDMTGNVKFYFTAGDTDVNKTSPYNAPQKFFFFNPDTKKLEIY
jgi:serine protease AprX